MDKILIVLKILPAIIAAIKAIEEAIPQGGVGAQKLEAVRQVLSTVDSSIDALWPIISKVVGVMVDLFNKTGVFPKGN